jgi:hypothetical protein
MSAATDDVQTTRKPSLHTAFAALHRQVSAALHLQKINTPMASRRTLLPRYGHTQCSLPALVTSGDQ